MVRALLRWLITILLIIGMAVVFLLSPPGLKTILIFLPKVLPGHLSYETISGALAGPLDIRGLRYQTKEWQLQIKQAHLQWNPLALLWKKISISDLKVNGVQVITTGVAHSRAPMVATPIKEIPAAILAAIPNKSAPLRHVPVTIAIQQGHVSDLRWNQFLISSMTVQGVAKDQHIDLEFLLQVVQPERLQSSIKLQGKLDDYHVQFDVIDKHRQISSHIIGQGDRNHLNLQTNRTTVLDGKLDGKANLQWFPAVQWQLDLQAVQVSPKRLDSRLPKRASIWLMTQGSHRYFSWDARLATADALIQMSGHHHKNWHALWNIKIPELAHLLPQGNGAIISSGELVGTHGSLWKSKTNGFLQLNAFQWHVPKQNLNIAELKTNWQVDASTMDHPLPLILQVAGKQISFNGLQLDALQLTGNGFVKQHQLSGQLNMANALVKWQLSGDLQHQHWHGMLQQLSMQSPWLGDWRLIKAGAVDLSPSLVRAEPLCFQIMQQGAEAQSCLQGNWQDKRRGQADSQPTWSFDWQGHVNLARLNWSLQNKLQVTNLLKFQINAQKQEKKSPTADVKVDLQPGELHYIDKKGQRIKLPLQANLTGTLDRQGWQSQMSLQLTAQNTLQANIVLPRYPRLGLFAEKQPIKGKVDFLFKKLDILGPILPHVIIQKGQLQGTLAMGGSLMQPTWRGKLELGDGTLTVPKINLVLNAIKMQLQAQGNQLNYVLTGQSAKKPVTIKGKTILTSGVPSEWQIQADNILLINTAEYIVYATPQVLIKTQGKDMDITGQIIVPSAKIHPIDLKDVIKLPDEDTVFVTPNPMEDKPFWRLSCHVDVSTNGKSLLDVNALGLSGNATGKLTIIKAQDQTTVAVGTINIINGQYDIYGRPLTIAPHSAITYRYNPLSNPYLNIQAYTWVNITDTTGQQVDMENVKAGLNIAGTAKSPQITFFSSSGNLSQADILSYIVLGTSSRNANAGSLALVVKALNGTAQDKKNTLMPGGVLDQIKQGLGFSELNLETDTTLDPLQESTTEQKTYVVIGKRLTPRLSVRYKVDPLSSMNILQVHYLLSHGFHLQTETSQQGTGADIFYTYAPAPKSSSKQDANKNPDAGSENKTSSGQ